MKKVLIVDDSETIRQQIVSVLEKASFAVLEARDGVDGLACLAENEDVAMILVDVNMPRLNGLEMLDKLKSDAKTRAIPVVMLTTEMEQSLIDRAKSSGAQAWIIKPVKPQLLVAAVNKLAR